jgi:hypothetical protein
MAVDAILNGDWFFDGDCRGRRRRRKGPGRPPAVPGDEETRLLRMQAHMSFDRLWKSGRLTRREAYGWLAGELGLTEAKAHMGQMTNKHLLRAVVTVCDREMGTTVAQDDFPDDLHEVMP